MKLEDQVCSLELAKKLKELGVKQESAFYWNYNERGTAPKLTKGRMLHPQSLGSPTWWDVSAFTVAELVHMAEQSANEFVFAYNDSSCDYIFAKGGKGTSGMIRECYHEGSEFYSYGGERGIFVDALAEWIAHLAEHDLLNRDFKDTDDLRDGGGRV